MEHKKKLPFPAKYCSNPRLVTCKRNPPIKRLRSKNKRTGNKYFSRKLQRHYYQILQNTLSGCMEDIASQLLKQARKTILLPPSPLGLFKFLLVWSSLIARRLFQFCQFICLYYKNFSTTFFCCGTTIVVSAGYVI